jgi:hypothetical protein
VANVRKPGELGNFGKVNSVQVAIYCGISIDLQLFCFASAIDPELSKTLDLVTK